MTAKNGYDDFKGGKERLLDLAKLSLEELLYYILVELGGKGDRMQRRREARLLRI